MIQQAWRNGTNRFIMLWLAWFIWRKVHQKAYKLTIISKFYGDLLHSQRNFVHLYKQEPTLYTFLPKYLLRCFDDQAWTATTITAGPLIQGADIPLFSLWQKAALSLILIVISSNQHGKMARQCLRNEPLIQECKSASISAGLLNSFKTAAS